MISEFFSFSVSPWVWLCLGIALIAAVTAISTGFLPLRRITLQPPASPDDEEASDAPDCDGNKVAGNSEAAEAESPAVETEEPAPAAAKPCIPVSVIAIAPDDSDPTEFIRAACRQKYDNFELIIVHEKTLAEHQSLAEQFEFTPELGSDGEPHGCRALRFCFFPPGSHALSRKKLGLTIGIKAAAGDVIITTSTACRIPSDYWIDAMMRHFSPSVDIVFGFSRPDFDMIHPHRALRRFGYFTSSARWILAALNHDPLRGDGYNLAYRRETFFKAKGFASTMYLVNGDDDLFIQEIATPDNTAVELSEDSILIPDFGDETSRIFQNTRDHYRFTSRWLPRGGFLRSGLTSCSQWLAVLAAVAACLVQLPNLLPLCFALPLLVAMFIIEARCYRKAASAFGDDRAWGATPFLLLARPIDNFLFDLNRRKTRTANFTYRR